VSKAPRTCASPLADLHVDTLYQVQYRRRPLDLTPFPKTQVTAASLEAGCVRFLLKSLFVPHGLKLRRAKPTELNALLAQGEALARAQRWTIGAPLPAPKNTRVLFSVEGGQVLASEAGLALIPKLVRRGVRVFGLVHAYDNDLAASSQDPVSRARRKKAPAKYPDGLTPLGQRYVDVVHASGGVIDVSHASDATFWQVVERAATAGAPVLATHSNARVLCGHRRNLTDKQLAAIGASGGLVGAMFHVPTLCRRDRRPPTVSDVARHITHLVKLAGPRAVAIGSDLDGLITAARGLENHRGIAVLVDELRRLGMSRATIRAVLYDNVQRVFSRFKN